MVVFTCNTCGESLKKKDVDTHYYVRKCSGGYPNLTCVDCLKDFGKEYVKHTVCVSEAQRYSANGLNAIKKTKQQIWVETVHEAAGRAIDDGVPGLTPSIKDLLLWLQQQHSIPDRPKTFSNFLTSARREPQQNIDFVWGILNDARQKMQAQLAAEREAELQARKEMKQKQMNEKKESSSSSDDSDSSDDEASKKVENANGHSKDTGSSVNESNEKKKKRMVSESESLINGTSESRKSKKSKKNPKEEESEDNSQLGSALDAVHLTEGPIMETQKLSKKEKKEKKKKERFEAQLKEMESVSTADDGEEEGDEEEEEGENAPGESPSLDKEETEDEKPKKKNKKIKNVVSNPEVEDALVGEKKKKKDKKKKNKDGSEEANIPVKGEEDDKKKKGRKNKKNGEETENEPMDVDVMTMKMKKGKSETCKLNETLNLEDLQSDQKFSWDSAILGILESKEEIALKKLTKKVCNGYLATLGEYTQEDEINAVNKFHKKLHKMHNVVVHKERVKLRTSRD